MEPVTDALEEICRRLAGVADGAVADYIPQLALADAEAFGLALVSMDGHRYQAGDAHTPFTIQSVSKPFVYALALADLGPDAVAARVGAEPSGEAFNAISLEPGTGRPANPMVNAGAIVATSLVRGVDAGERFERIRACLSAFAGRALDVDEEVYASEAATGDRNRALAYLMRAAGALDGDVGEEVDTYFRQCSVRVTACDLALMAATLAHGGANPVTGEQVVTEDVATRVMAVMATCGMYDRAGTWLLDVGLPAKSGVAGGLIAVSPARFGIAVYSPPLDEAGNPVRGVRALTEVSRRFGLHMMRPAGRHAVTVTEATTGGKAGAAWSERARGPEENARLAAEGHRIVLVAAQGGLEFTETEQILHAVDVRVPEQPGWIVLDLTRVTAIAQGSAMMLGAALAAFARQGHHIVIAAQRDFPAPVPDTPSWHTFPDRGAALAWSEDQLLGETADFGES
jgi:glutaminase